MADTKISALASATPVETDEMVIVDDPGGTPSSKRILISALLGLLRTQLALTTTGNGASLIGLEDSAGLTDETTVEGVITAILQTLDNHGDIVSVDQADIPSLADADVIIFDAGGSSSAARPSHSATKTVIWFNHGSSLPTNLGTFDIAAGGLFVEPIVIAASDETSDLTTGTAKRTFRMPFGLTLTGVRASVSTAPTGAVVTVDINKNGTTVLSTKLTIDAGEKTSTTAATAAVISDTSLADDDEITIDIDTVGSTVAGVGLKVTLLGTRT